MLVLTDSTLVLCSYSIYAAVNVMIREEVGKSVISTQVVDSVVYSCQAENEAGNSTVQSCPITVVEQGTRKFCYVNSVVRKHSAVVIICCHSSVVCRRLSSSITRDKPAEFIGSRGLH